jgi:hypothetical protein
MKVADIKLTWKRSVSTDVKRVEMKLVIDGVETVAALAPDVQEHLIAVSANTSFAFQLMTFDTEGLVSSSLIYSAQVGDLTAPEPATELSHEVIGVRDLPVG